MASFENYPEASKQICLEIERKFVSLGVDWRDEFALRNLAVQVMAQDPAAGYSAVLTGDRADILKELYGLVGIMLRTQEESAAGGSELSGTDAWKAFARALWAVKEYPSAESLKSGS